jgi:plastocyanin
VTRLAPFALACAAVLVQAGAQSAELSAVVRDERGAPLADAVVVAVPESGAARAPQPRVEQVEQIDLEFVPGVKAIQAGTAVSFPNRDKVRHHVYSFSAPKRFDLPLYAGTPPQPVLFDLPGVVTIGCNIHDWMIGYLYVAESPYFAKSDAAGAARIADLPAGRYAVRVWHPRLATGEEATRRSLELGAAGATLEWRLALKPEVRVRRSPAAGHGGRY